MTTEDITALDSVEAMTDQVLKAFQSGTALDVYSDSPEEAQYRIALQHLEAQSWDEMFGGVVKSADLLNVPLRISRVSFYPSEHFDPAEPKKNPPAFEVLEATLLGDALSPGGLDIAHAKGDVVKVSVGGWDAFSVFLGAAKRGEIGNGESKDIVIVDKETRTPGRTVRKIQPL